VLPPGFARIDREKYVITAFDKIRELENQAEECAVIAELAYMPTRRAFYANLSLQYRGAARARWRDERENNTDTHAGRVP